MYTINGAYAMRQEDKTGSLVEGKVADFVVVDKDIFELERNGMIDEIKETKIKMTVLEGEEIWIAP